jgi:aryl-alcohol dehydrogenase-like predicted oxidoreductase
MWIYTSVSAIAVCHRSSLFNQIFDWNISTWFLICLWFLTGQIRSRDDIPPDEFQLFFPKFAAENFDKILELSRKLEAIACRKGYTSIQSTMAWLMAQGDEIIPIPGTRNVKYLEENVAATKITLTGPEEIRDAIESAEINGARYPEL